MTKNIKKVNIEQPLLPQPYMQYGNECQTSKPICPFLFLFSLCLYLSESGWVIREFCLFALLEVIHLFNSGILVL